MKRSRPRREKWSLFPVVVLDLDITGDERHLAKALCQGIEIKVDVPFKDLAVKFEGGSGARLVWRAFADLFHGFLRNAALITLVVFMPIAVDMHFTPF